MTENELYHHGILGMKWGVRRYQNPDGSLTEAGKKRYNVESSRTTKIKAEIVRADKAIKDANGASERAAAQDYRKRLDSDLEKSLQYDMNKSNFRIERDRIVKSRSTGKNIANVVVNGPFGALSFNDLRAAGVNPYAAEAITMVSYCLSGGLANLAISALVRQSQYNKTEISRLMETYNDEIKKKNN